jgi:hypothetical protein
MDGRWKGPPGVLVDTPASADQPRGQRDRQADLAADRGTARESRFDIAHAIWRTPRAARPMSTAPCEFCGTLYVAEGAFVSRIDSITNFPVESITAIEIVACVRPAQYTFH